LFCLTSKNPLLKERFNPISEITTKYQKLEKVKVLTKYSRLSIIRIPGDLLNILEKFELFEKFELKNLICTKNMPFGPEIFPKKFELSRNLN